MKSKLHFFALLSLSVLALAACEKKLPEDAMENEMEGAMMKTTFMGLLELNENHTCTFEQADDAGMMTSGRVYVEASGNRFRGEFTMEKPDGEEMEVNIIRDDMMNYIWTSMQEEGIKIKANETSLFGESQENAGIDEHEPVDFDCKNWSPEDRMFDPPTDREFIDMNKQMEGILDDVDEMKSTQCDACNQLPKGAQREQCLSVMGC